MGWSPYRQTGLTHQHPAQSFKGYTLITPIRGDAAYLIDVDGRIVHRWHFRDVRAWYGRLLPNGRLLIGGIDSSLPPPPQTPFDQPPPPFDQHIRRLGGGFTHLLEVEWDGTVVWQYRNDTMHHDFAMTPDGTFIISAWVEIEPELTRAVRGGVRRPREKFPPMLSDDFIEIDRNGTEVRRLQLARALDPARDRIGPLMTRWEWTHTNSVAITRAGALLISCRSTSCVYLLDRESGQLLWRWGTPQISAQHHATELPNGNIQIFDNGQFAIGLPRSRVVEVNPANGQIVWEYTADPPQQFFSGHISGAERLPGDNVLICEGASGRIFEVTRRGDVVWEWVTPFVVRGAGPNSVAIFRAHRYPPDYPGLAGRDLDPARYLSLNRLHGLA
jgi:outer membrane protein assembly factor BamB